MLKPDQSILQELEEQRPSFAPGLLSRAEKDRLIERGIAGLFRWYQARSQAKRNWNPDRSFDWRNFRTDLSPELNTVLEGFYAVEQYAPDYTVRTIQMNRRSYGRSQFQIRWGSEEEKHSDLWLNTLLFSRYRSPEWIEDYQNTLREQVWQTPWDDPLHGTLYVVFQERATQLNYLNTAIIARGKSDKPEHKDDIDPILAQAAETIAIDEAAHYYFFLEIARLFLYYYPAETVEALFDVIKHFAMPALDIIPNAKQLGEQLYRSGIYGPREFSSDVVQVALRNLGFESRAALTRGIKKTRLVPDEDGNLFDSSIFELFDYNSVELAVKKLFGKVQKYEQEVGLDAIKPTEFKSSGMGPAE
ncbi:MAG: acyl-ACP desaturase [Chloroflexi bacterium]|nr:acyl-ACP desaturase [Chloroflexota bacterium]